MQHTPTPSTRLSHTQQAASVRWQTIQWSSSSMQDIDIKAHVDIVTQMNKVSLTNIQTGWTLMKFPQVMRWICCCFIYPRLRGNAKWWSSLTVEHTYAAGGVKHLLKAENNSFPTTHSCTAGNKTDALFLHLSECRRVCFICWLVCSPLRRSELCVCKLSNGNTSDKTGAIANGWCKNAKNEEESQLFKWFSSSETKMVQSLDKATKFSQCQSAKKSD